MPPRAVFLVPVPRLAACRPSAGPGGCPGQTRAWAGSGWWSGDDCLGKHGEGVPGRGGKGPLAGHRHAVVHRLVFLGWREWRGRAQLGWAMESGPSVSRHLVLSPCPPCLHLWLVKTCGVAWLGPCPLVTPCVQPGLHDLAAGDRCLPQLGKCPGRWTTCPWCCRRMPPMTQAVACVPPASWPGPVPWPT